MKTAIQRNEALGTSESELAAYTGANSRTSVRNKSQFSPIKSSDAPPSSSSDDVSAMAVYRKSGSLTRGMSGSISSMNSRVRGDSGTPTAPMNRMTRSLSIRARNASAASFGGTSTPSVICSTETNPAEDSNVLVPNPLVSQF